MAFTIVKLVTCIVAIILSEALVAKKGPNNVVEERILLSKKSMLVGMSETTEEVCQTAIIHDYEPVYGHLTNGSRVEIEQDSHHKFRKTYVACLGDDRPSCHGVKDEMYISECVTVYENRNTMVRFIGSRGPYSMGAIKVPILCECRLRRQFRDFERRDDNDSD